jgi:tetratricopeptide (TPR) repeat protein
VVVATRWESPAELNWIGKLVDQGRFAEAVGWLRGRERDATPRSGELALFCAIAHGRLGRYGKAVRCVELALAYAGGQRLSGRALNARGAIALETGRLDQARADFLQGLAEASALGDLGTVGRCCNNLGIVANLRGRMLEAARWYAPALASFRHASWPQGIAETENNLRVTYRDLGRLDYALESAERAVSAAEHSGNFGLLAFALAGRAEIRTLRGETHMGERDIRRALVIHRNQEDVIGEAEDLRILAMTTAALGHFDDAERTYHETIERAEHHDRPALAAEAARSLAVLLAEQGRRSEAGDAARIARGSFSRLGAESQVRRIDALADRWD